MKWLRSLFCGKGGRLSENPEAHVSEGLSSNTTLAVWGNNEYGQTKVPSGTDFVAIAVERRQARRFEKKMYA